MNSLFAFRPGSAVQVRSPSEIFETLDESGALDGLPFMPEMLPFAARYFGSKAVRTKHATPFITAEIVG